MGNHLSSMVTSVGRRGEKSQEGWLNSRSSTQARSDDTLKVARLWSRASARGSDLEVHEGRVRSTAEQVFLGESEGQERIGSSIGVTPTGTSTDTPPDQPSEVESVAGRDRVCLAVLPAPREMANRRGKGPTSSGVSQNPIADSSDEVVASEVSGARWVASVARHAQRQERMPHREMRQLAEWENL
jgi:hypothetical protein